MNCSSVRISGTPTPYIKGTFIPSKTERSGPYPIFHKADSDRIILVFDTKSSKWKVRDKRPGGKYVTVAKVLCRPSGPPESITSTWVEKIENSRGKHYVEVPTIAIQKL